MGATLSKGKGKEPQERVAALLRGSLEAFVAKPVEEMDFTGVVVAGAQFGFGRRDDLRALHMNQFKQLTAAANPGGQATQRLVAQLPKLSLGLGQFVGGSVFVHGLNVVHNWSIGKAE